MSLHTNTRCQVERNGQSHVSFRMRLDPNPGRCKGYFYLWKEEIFHCGLKGSTSSLQVVEVGSALHGLMGSLIVQFGKLE